MSPSNKTRARVFYLTKTRWIFSNALISELYSSVHVQFNRKYTYEMVTLGDSGAFSGERDGTDLIHAPRQLDRSGSSRALFAGEGIILESAFYMVGYPDAPENH